MANHKSAIKRIRQNEKRRIYNRKWRNRSRSLSKDARDAIQAGEGNIDEIRAQVKEAVRELDKSVSRGVIHKRNAARRKSRLMKQLAALEANK
jgi:small subunit ribosomal protein S20